MSEMLSAVVVAYNEARYLSECLRRLTFCDEILVIDLGSQDGSIEIAKGQDARVIQHEWVPFAEKVRGFALEHVKNDWVILVDPDLYIPTSLGEKVRVLIGNHSDHNLGMIFLPIFTFFGNRPLRFGQKGGRRGYRGVIHRDRVEIPAFLHHQGVQLRDDYFALCLIATDEEVICHHWVDTIREAFIKGHRYLPYEPEKRHALGQTFSWSRMFSELGRSLKMDLRKLAFLEWHAMQVMFFQLWYISMANITLRRFERV